MTAITSGQLGNIISQIFDIVLALKLPLLFICGFYLGLFVLEQLVKIVVSYTTGASERRINEAVEGRYQGELSIGEWGEVYRRKSAGYKKMVSGTKTNEKDYLTTFKQ